MTSEVRPALKNPLLLVCITIGLLIAIAWELGNLFHTSLRVKGKEGEGGGVTTL